MLTLLIGPVAAGKSTFAAANYPAHHIISSNKLREEWNFDPLDHRDNEKLFYYIQELAILRLACGMGVVVDATNLRKRDRLKFYTGCRTKYIVFDRPLEDKIRDRGWRSEELVKKYHARFQGALPDILAGDDYAIVEDRRER